MAPRTFFLFSLVGLLASACSSAPDVAEDGMAASEDELKGARPLVEYDYGNQITRSSLKILADGTVKHGENVCCPHRTVPVPEKKLSATTLQALEGWIQSASKGELKVSSGSPTSMGSRSGTLVATTRQGKKVNVRAIERSNTAGGFDKVTSNLAPEVEDILALVLDFTDVDMPSKN